MDSSRRKLVYVAIACFLVGAAGIAVGVHLTNSVETSGDIPLVAPNGMEVHVVGDTQQDLTSNFPTSGSVDVVTEEGNVSFFASGDANATVTPDNITGTWTNVTQINADPSTITIDPEDKSSVVVGNEIDSVAFRASFAVDDGTVDFVYAGTTGQSRVTVQGVPVNQELAAVDADTGAYLDSATSNSGGAVTFDALDNSEHAVLIQTADFQAPTLSNPSPTGDLSTEPSTISVAVNDTEFDQGDSVDVTIDLDGSQIHTETITANQTVDTSIPASGLTGGAHEWSVEAEDSFGESTGQTHEYRIPANITVRNELNHSEIIDSPISVDGTFFGSEQIFERNNIDDGVIDMTGLPVTEDYIVEVEPSNENYTTRAVYLQSIFQQESVYLLNTSAVDTTQTRFVLEDPTGQFDSSTVLFIERPINVSGSTTWQTIHADEFGAEGVTATLEEGQRYRLRVQSSDGTAQVVGPYRADASETVTVQPGTPSIELGDFEDGVAANAVLNNVTLDYRYADPDNETDELTVWIHEKGDESNRLQANESYFDLGEMNAQSTLTVNESEKTWVVNFVINRGDEQFIKIVEVGNQRNVFPGLPNPWGAIAGIGLLLMLGGAFSELNVAAGAVIVACVGGILWFIGLLGGAGTAIGITLGLFAAVVNQIRKGGP